MILSGSNKPGQRSQQDVARCLGRLSLRKGEIGMVNFVLRHNSTKLKDRYVAPLLVEEVTGKQDIMEHHGRRTVREKMKY